MKRFSVRPLRRLPRRRRAFWKAGRPAVLGAPAGRACGAGTACARSRYPGAAQPAWRVEGLESIVMGAGSRFYRTRTFPLSFRWQELIRWRTRERPSRRLPRSSRSGGDPRGRCSCEMAGALERIAEDPDIILEFMLIPAGARALADYIRRFFADEPVRIIYGAMRDKAVEEVTNTLFPLAAEVIATEPDHPRALSPEALADMIDHPRVRQAANIGEAMKIGKEEKMTTCITGSPSERPAFYA